MFVDVLVAFLFATTASSLMVEHRPDTTRTGVQFSPCGHYSFSNICLVAQWTERDASIVKVAGSNPAEGTNNSGIKLN